MTWTLADDHRGTGWYENTDTGEKMRIEKSMIGNGPMFIWKLVHVRPDGSVYLLARSNELIERYHPECRPEDAIMADSELGKLHLYVGKILGYLE